MSYFGKQKRHFYKPKCSLHFFIITAATPARSHRYWRSGFVIHTNAQKEKKMHQVNNDLADLCFLLWNRVFLTASGSTWQYIPLSGLWMFPQYWYYKARESHTLSYFYKTLVTLIDSFDFKAFLNPLQQEFSRFLCAKSFRATKCTFLTSVSYVSTQRLGVIFIMILLELVYKFFNH